MSKLLTNQLHFMGHLNFAFETMHVVQYAHPYNEHYTEQLENDATSNVQSSYIYICPLTYSLHFVFNILVKNENCS